MSKLITTYARATGLRVSRGGPTLKEAFYPLAQDRYITLQTGSNQGAKNWDHFGEVLRLIKPMLEANQIAVVHLGGAQDPHVEGVVDLRGKTSILQSHYLIRRSMLHLGNDSWLAHAAGWCKRPLVALYGSTSIANHSPYWCDPLKTSLIEAHRWGGVPTYSANEQPKSINTIDPFRVANEVLRLLGIQHVFTQQTRFHGVLYPHLVLELIPNTVPAPEFCPGHPIVVRMDYHHDEDILIKVLQTGRRVNILTNRPITPAILQQFKGSILSYNHEVGGIVPEAQWPSREYIQDLKRLCSNSVVFTKEQDPAKLAALRFLYFDCGNGIEQVRDLTRDDYVNTALGYLNLKDTPENRLDLVTQLSYTFFRSQRYILSGGSVYLNLPHLRAGRALNSLADNEGQVMDETDFWVGLNHLTLFYVPPVHRDPPSPVIP